MQHLTKRFALTTLLFLGASAQAGVVSTLDYTATVSAGDEASDSASYLVNAVGQTADETALADDNSGSIAGLAGAQGIAEFTPTELRFGQTTAGVGLHTATATTVMTQQITNDGPDGVIGTFRSEILAGGLSLIGIGNDTSISSFDAEAGFAIDISLDGTSLFSFSASVFSDGTTSQTNLGFLNGLAGNVAANALSLGWQDSLLDLDLGVFSADQTKELVLTMSTTTVNNTDCVELAGPCLLASSSIGDPPGGGFGSVMLFSLYLPPTEVPEPGTAALIGVGVLGLMARRRRAARR